MQVSPSSEARALPRQGVVDLALSIAVRWALSSTVHALSSGLRGYRSLRGELTGLEIVRDLAYGAQHPDQVLDVWRANQSSNAMRPALVYFHGGGFQRLSKDTHWHIAERFARAGFVVFNCNYGLSPRHRYPVAVHDALTAYQYVIEHAVAHGADPSRLVVGGESAGANLALGLAIACGQRLTSAHAQRLHERGSSPHAALLFSGLLQTSQLARFFDGKQPARAIRARVDSISIEYAGRWPHDAPDQPADPLLDPLLYLEQSAPRSVTLPAIFASVGTHDPIRSDTLRLERWLRSEGKPHRVDIYRGEPHAFESLPFRSASQRVFRDTLDFLRAFEVIA